MSLVNSFQNLNKYRATKSIADSILALAYSLVNSQDMIRRVFKVGYNRLKRVCVENTDSKSHNTISTDIPTSVSLDITASASSFLPFSLVNNAVDTLTATSVNNSALKRQFMAVSNKSDSVRETSEKSLKQADVREKHICLICKSHLISKGNINKLEQMYFCSLGLFTMKNCNGSDDNSINNMQARELKTYRDKSNPPNYFDLMNENAMRVWKSISHELQDKFISCEECNKSFHMLCAGLTRFPDADEDWFCTLCRAGKYY